jgi:hypothetical protein
MPSSNIFAILVRFLRLQEISADQPRHPLPEPIRSDTRPNQCYHCDATQKVYLTFFSRTEDSGLIDGQGRFVGTWPAVAFIGYGICSSLALKRKKMAT